MDPKPIYTGFGPFSRKAASSGEGFILTSLGLALIEKHGFFQGRGSRYRIDPAQAVALLGLTGQAT